MRLRYWISIYNTLKRRILPLTPKFLHDWWQLKGLKKWDFVYILKKSFKANFSFIKSREAISLTIWGTNMPHLEYIYSIASSKDGCQYRELSLGSVFNTLRTITGVDTYHKYADIYTLQQQIKKNFKDNWEKHSIISASETLTFSYVLGWIIGEKCFQNYWRN